MISLYSRSSFNFIVLIPLILRYSGNIPEPYKTPMNFWMNPHLYLLLFQARSHTIENSGPWPSDCLTGFKTLHVSRILRIGMSDLMSRVQDSRAKCL